MPSYTYENLMSAMRCIAPAPPAGWMASGVSTDTRNIEKGNLFFALSGENFDAHDFLADAVKSGASGLVIDKRKKSSVEAVLAAFPPEICIIEADDTLAALQSLASWSRGRLKSHVIAVTGSSGKTSVKEMLMGILIAAGKKTGGTKGNLNNHIGLPLTLCRAEPEDEFLILEMGMNHAGEISLLSRIAKPDISIITSISGAHMGFFNSIRDILNAKLEIMDGMEPESDLIYCATSGFVDEVRDAAAPRKIHPVFYGFGNSNAGIEKKASDMKVDIGGIRFLYGGFEMKNSHYFSPEMAENLLGCLVVLEKAGLTPENLIRAVPEVRPVTPGRFQVYRKKSTTGETCILVDDSYNANGDSFCRAISALRRIMPRGKLALFAGEMAELGRHSSQEHERVGIRAGLEKYDIVIAAGSLDAKTLLDSYGGIHPDGRRVLAESTDHIISELDIFLEDISGILVKGSRRAGMDKVAKAIKDRGYV